VTSEGLFIRDCCFGYQLFMFLDGVFVGSSVFIFLVLKAKFKDLAIM